MLKTKLSYLNKIYNFKKNIFAQTIFCLLLSWFYALCSQIIIPLPFNLIPISLQPLPLFLAASILGWPAIFAYILTLIQTALGAPFFSGFQGGIIKLLGPTGGYILGFLVAMIFLTATKDFMKKNIFITFLKIVTANILFYACGLSQLSLFVPFNKLLLVGLYPFLFGCFIKIIIVVSVVHNLCKTN